MRRHPPTGTKALFLTTTRLERIVDLDRAESDPLDAKRLLHRIIVGDEAPI